MVTTDPLLGRLVDGRYEVLERVARGGMATVYRALDRRLDREVALKVMHPHLAEGAEASDFLSRFRREARAAAGLTHSGVVAVFDQGIDGDMSYLTMEYVAGTNLRRAVRDGGVTVRRVFDVLDQVLSALAAAHRKGVVHRDIKPENVLLVADSDQVKVADFGLARAVTEVTATSTGTVMGTVAYLAPEVISTGRADTRTDVYAVGVLAFEMLTGRLPHPGDSPIQIAFAHVNADVAPPSSLAPHLPRAVDDLVRSFAARNPDARPRDAAAALEVLRAVRRTLPDGVLEATASTAPRAPGGQAPATPAPSSTALMPGVPGVPGGAVVPAGPQHQVSTPTTALPAQPGYVQPYPAYGGYPGQAMADAEPPRLDKRRATGTIVTAVIVLVLLVLGGLWWLRGDRVVQVPGGLVGLPVAEAQAELEAAGLEWQVTQEFDDTVAVGSVVSTDPGAGAVVARGDVVQLVESKGPDLVALPGNLVGLTEADARAALADAGFTVKEPLSTDYSDTVPAGSVMASSPEPGTQALRGSEVALVVSEGGAPTEVPSVVDLTFDEAVAALTAAGLKAEKIEEFDPEIPAGQVVAQNPEEGDEAHRGDTVQLLVSKGPELVAVPDVVGMDRKDAKETLEASGFKVDDPGLNFVLDDTVSTQSPAAGEQVAKGSEVTISNW
ncbi:Stk1 family PASTA domain-containing Ser/Thr kinase [Antribacter sp. KLBMP9083]|uniref:non-specific serine/threonine protein kinase n=1 Tax=Antribacter soli TaxID=2910976 RepID=A0AA41U821_9MICO|nr:Stk1 family PASTA domain-containing Ser/Thr kinase [Antribacter soli]MCF4122578.1 Stk1 family PASTA domain-containing Ser/Thr kinase [Antribacter soli]